MKRFLAQFLVLILSLSSLSSAWGAGVVTATRYVQLTRGGVPLSSTTTPKLGCSVPTTPAECNACLTKMVDAESKTRTTGYITYRCLDIAQSYVKFNKNPVVIPPPVEPPPTPTQVLSCPEAGADGRLLESATLRWPNCPSAVFKNPSRALVVAVNTGAPPLYWRLASTVTDGRVWARTGTIETWTQVEDIAWGSGPTPPDPVPPIPSGPGSATLNWRPSTHNIDGSPLTNLAKYAVYYSTSPIDMGDRVRKAPIEVAGTILSYRLEGLSTGPWYFAVSAINAAGQEGNISNILKFTVN